MKQMQVLVLNGSPHFDQGATGHVLRPFLEGMEQAGATVETFYTKKMDVSPCLGCFTCWTKTPGTCVQRDDMDELLPKIGKSDIVVLATPVYVDGMTNTMKKILDRSIPLIHGFCEIIDDHCRHPPRDILNQDGKIALVSVCGFAELDNFDPLLYHVKAMAKNMHREFAGAILRPYAWAIPPALKMDMDLSELMDALKNAGRQLIKDGQFDSDTLEMISRDILPRETVVEFLNAWISESLERNTD
jgi:hypothetical protein